MAIAMANTCTSSQRSDSVHKRNKGSNSGMDTEKFDQKKPLATFSTGMRSNVGDGTEQEFFWTYTEEPHRTRRQAIIKAHPEVTKLCGPEPLTKYTVTAVVALQVLCTWLLRDTPVSSWQFLVTAYVIGATANQNLFLAIHEISHNLAFKAPLANRLLAIFANLPIGIPYSASFRPYHLTHHKSLGVDGLDTDLPTALEATLLDSVLGKAFFCTFQILFYALRPMMIYQLPITRIHILNIVVQLLFDAVLVRLVGVRALAYLILSSFLAGSLHPCAAHFIAEHYVLDAPHERSASNLSAKAKVTATATATRASAQLQPESQGQPPLPETFSYYGPLNLLTYNVGLHNEHHDFPAVPWTRLPRLHAIAKDFYRDTPRHESWVNVFWLFIWDERVGLWCRVKRVKGGRKVGGGVDGGNASNGKISVGGSGAGAGIDANGSGDGNGWREDELGANEVKGGQIPGVL